MRKTGPIALFFPYSVYAGKFRVKTERRNVWNVSLMKFESVLCLEHVFLMSL